MAEQTKIPVPRELLDSLVEAQDKWEDFSNELEDFLLSRNDSFIKEMKKARRQHQKGELSNIEDLS